MSERIRVGKTTSAILRAEEDVSLWSDEELIRGQRRATNGKWQGRPPKVVPKSVHDELVKRKLSKAYDLLADSIYDAVAVLVEVAQDKDADPNVRVKAATEILNRTMGKPKETLELGFQPMSEFDRALEEVIIDRTDVIDVEAWEEAS